MLMNPLPPGGAFEVLSSEIRCLAARTCKPSPTEGE